MRRILFVLSVIAIACIVLFCTKETNTKKPVLKGLAYADIVDYGYKMIDGGFVQKGQLLPLPVGEDMNKYLKGGRNDTHFVFCYNYGCAKFLQQFWCCDCCGACPAWTCPSCGSPCYCSIEGGCYQCSLGK